MKYFSLSTVKRAYDSISLTTKDKFWGILGIFYSVDSLVKPNLNYAIDTPKLSNFLENIFRFKNKKSYDEYDSSYSVVFANNWESKVSEYFLIGRPNLLPIIVWAYRNTVFGYEYTVEDLLEKFVNDFHLSKENIENLFNISRSDFELEYVDFLYDDSILLKDLGVVSSDATTLKMNKSFVVANAGDLSRGPFFQPLYASLNTIECLIIFPFKNTDYYHLFTPFLSDVDVNNQTSIEDEYIEFLKITTPKSVPNYSSSSFGRIERTLKSIFKTDKDVSIYSYTTVEAVKQIIDILQSNREFLEYNETGRRQYSNALDWYVKFLTLRSMFSNIRDMQVKNNQDLSDKPLQQIYYGAPGTGKSHTINEVTKNVNSDFVFRTTFHPDSDYSTFVGAYKPTMRELPRYNPQTGDKIGVEEKIVYSFVPQIFLNAYVKAWQNQDKSVYLVIEEINRGNCAQIFGDLFQLLDRTENGVSEYPIKADQDIKDYLVKAFAECEGLPEKIKSGDELQLPSNLYIWATMNTSDQSLFPIDSAFKRRWDWEYMPITKGVDKYGNEMNWSIVIGEKCYDWWEFLDKVNEKIGEETSSEDKKLGFFFCKADSNDEILIDKFVNKVLFYLWNDVFKTCGVEYHYKDGEAEKLLTFDKFHIKGGYDVDKIQNWLEKDLELSAKENLKSGDAYAETKEQSLKYARLNKDFWTKFLDYARNQSSRKDEYLEYFDGRKTPTDDHWYAFTLKKGCTLNVVQLRSQNKLFVGLAISKTDYNIFEKLKDKRGEIEKDLDLKPNTLVWDEKPDRKTDNIIHRIDVDFDESKQQEQFDWIIERLLKMREVFSKYLL